MVTAGCYARKSTDEGNKAADAKTRRIEEEFFRSLRSRNRKREPRVRVVRGVLQVQVAVGLSPIGRPDDID